MTYTLWMMFWGLLAEAWSNRRDARVRFLVAQIEMLRDRVPGHRVIVTPEERAWLIKPGEAVGAWNGVLTISTPFQAPIANCNADSWIGTLTRECLNHFTCLGLRHLDHIVQTYVGYYNRLRPHQGKDNRPLTMSNAPIPIRASESPPPTEEVGAVQRYELLGGLLSHYEWKAA